MLKKIFASDQSYKEMALTYNKTDALMSIGLYLFLMTSYFLTGIVQMKIGIYIGIYVNLIMMIICIILVIARKQKLNTIGLTRKYFGRALLTGFTVGVCFSLVYIILAIQSGCEITSEHLIYNIFYHLVIIGMQEEMLFRGYIQPRLYGIIKSDILAVILGGLMFATTHIPYQMFCRNMGNFSEFISENYIWLISTFMMHFIFNYLYRKYNSLTAPTIVHWLINLSDTLIR